MILHNPIFIIHLGKVIWKPIKYIMVLLFGVFAFLNKKMNCLKANYMINKKLLLLSILFFFLNIIFAQQANKKNEGLIRKGIIINAEGKPDIITKQGQFDKQNAEMLKFHKEAELAQQATDREFKKKEMELLVTKQKAKELKKQQEQKKKQVALQKKETIFHLCIIICLVFFSVLSFLYFKNNLKGETT